MVVFLAVVISLLVGFWVGLVVGTGRVASQVLDDARQAAAASRGRHADEVLEAWRSGATVRMQRYADEDRATTTPMSRKQIDDALRGDAKRGRRP